MDPYLDELKAFFTTPKIMMGRDHTHMTPCMISSTLLAKPEGVNPNFSRITKYMMRPKVYMGTIIAPRLDIAPTALQVAVFPTAKRLAGVSLGAAKGPTR